MVPKPVVSPVEALLELFSSIAKANNLRKIHLMVNDDNGNNIKVLPRIYNKYRFTETIEGCHMEGYMAMEKDLSGGA